MPNPEIARYRLLNQAIAARQSLSAAQVVTRLGAMQAQDYPASLWAVALRTPQANQAAVEQAIADRQIVRTWPMRGTLHLVAAADVRWMLALLTPRVLAGSATRHRQLELDEAVFKQSKRLMTKALEGGRTLARNEIFEVLEREDIACANQRGYHILWKLSQEGLLCCANSGGKQPTFALLEEWLPPAPTLTREESLAELARRYFTGHGPATIEDLAWWAGLKITEARAALEAVKADLVNASWDGKTYWMPPALAAQPDPLSSVYLLPGFDEYVLGYTDRTATLTPENFYKIVPGGNGIFMPMLVSNGEVVGTWKRAVKKNTLTVTLLPFDKLSEAELEMSEVAAQGYGRFLGLPVALS